MEATPILYDTHMHTPLCKHAKGEPGDYAAVAEKRGLKGIVVTCHNPGPNGFSPRVRMALEQFDEYVDLVERARQAWNGRIDIRLGLECDYLPEMEPFLEKLLGLAAPEDRGEAGISVHTWLYLQGVDILRVHDIKTTAAVRVFLQSVDRFKR